MIPAIPVYTDKLFDLCQHFRVRRMSLFGSVLRPDFGPQSDVDVLVEFQPDAHISYFEMADLQDALAEMLGRPVDLLTPAALSKYFRKKVLDSALLIYERS